MQHNRPPGLFVTGTDTGVGKTYVAAMISMSLAQAGYRVGVYKPVASGCIKKDGRFQMADGGTRKAEGGFQISDLGQKKEQSEGESVARECAELVSDDAARLWDAAGRPGELGAVCPQRFAAPLAPHLAARAEGRQVDAQLLRSGLEYWYTRSDVIVVEGAGGLMSPLADDEYNADLAFDLGYPLVVVAVNKIGVINQTLQTLIAAKTFRDGIPVAGIVLNNLSTHNDDPSRESNFAELTHHCQPPVLAQVDCQGQGFDRVVDWYDLAKRGTEQ